MEVSLVILQDKWISKKKKKINASQQLNQHVHIYELVSKQFRQ